MQLPCKGIMTQKQGFLMLLKVLVETDVSKQQDVLYAFIYMSLCRDTACLHVGYKKLALVLHGGWECASAAGVPAGCGLIP